MSVSQWEFKVKTGKEHETRENAGGQIVIVFLVLNLIGWEVGASFLDQSQNEVKQI